MEICIEFYIVSTDLTIGFNIFQKLSKKPQVETENQKYKIKMIAKVLFFKKRLSFKYKIKFM